MIDYGVIIAGGRPTGTMLGGELAPAGVDVAERHQHYRALEQWRWHTQARSRGFPGPIPASAPTLARAEPRSDRAALRDAPKGGILRTSACRPRTNEI